MKPLGETKFPGADLLATSSGRGWPGIAAELRRHPAGEIPNIVPRQMEITLAIRPDAEGVVERRGNGRFQATRARPGTLWFCPIGVREDSIRITKTLPEVLHLYFPERQFEAISELSSSRVSPGAIAYAADVEDALVRRLGVRLLRELRQESAGGRLLADALGTRLLTHLVTHYAGEAAISGRALAEKGGLDARRLRRVLDYIAEHFTRDVSVDELASVACFSRYHFARAFQRSTGLPPHRYVAEQRLDYAKSMLGTGLSLAEIALHCGFSSQSSFTRAFQRGTGLAPGAYRRLRD